MTDDDTLVYEDRLVALSPEGVQAIAASVGMTPQETRREVERVEREPWTEAGRKLAGDFMFLINGLLAIVGKSSPHLVRDVLGVSGEGQTKVVESVAAIEAEARSAAIDAVEKAVKGLGHYGYLTARGEDPSPEAEIVSRAAVLAAIATLRGDPQ